MAAAVAVATITPAFAADRAKIQAFMQVTGFDVSLDSLDGYGRSLSVDVTSRRVVLRFWFLHPVQHVALSDDGWISGLSCP